MFGFFNKNKEQTVEPQLVAVQSGKVVKVETLPDPVFAEKMLGDGFAILPSDDNIVVSPVNATIEEVQDTLHAYCLKTDDGLDILVHIGINTVSLNGKGFTPKVKQGDKVKVGDILAKVDLDFIKSKGLPTYTVVLITNIDDLKSFQLNSNIDATSGETVILTYNK